VNGTKPTLCEMCGEIHGYGNHNKVIPIISVNVNTKIYTSYAGTYADKNKDIVVVVLKDKKLWVTIGEDKSKEIELIPVAENEFDGSGLPSRITFMKNASEKVTGFINHDLVPNTFSKTNNL